MQLALSDSVIVLSYKDVTNGLWVLELYDTKNAVNSRIIAFSDSPTLIKNTTASCKTFQGLVCLCKEQIPWRKVCVCGRGGTRCAAIPLYHLSGV